MNQRVSALNISGSNAPDSAAPSQFPTPAWQRAIKTKLQYGVIGLLLLLVVLYNVAVTHDQIDLLRQAGQATAGQVLYLTISPPDISQFIQSALNSLIMLSFIALILERTLEVFVISFRIPQKAQLEASVRQYSNELETAGDIAGWEDALEQATARLAAYKTNTQVIVQLVALTIGVLLGFAGIRVLEPLFSSSSFLALPWLQQVVLRCLDVIMTGLAIAGGSDGIHQISSYLGAYLEQPRSAV